MNTRHIVLTKQDGAISLYIDGKLEDLKDGTEISVWTFDPAAIEEFRSRFKYEVVKALEGMKRCQPSAWGEGECAACREGFNEDCTTKAIQECIETIKKL